MNISFTRMLFVVLLALFSTSATAAAAEPEAAADRQWSGWTDLGGVVTAGPAVSSWSANRLDVFAKGTDNQLWHKWWNGSSWSGWENLGGVFLHNPAAVSWGPNRIDVFVEGTNNHVYHKAWY